MELDPTAQSITLEKDRDSSWAKINMSREPVNSMNYAFWQRLTDILQACEQSSEIRGVIFYSGLKKPIFSAGNDLGELFAPGTSRERYKRFWATSQEFLCQLYVTPLVTVSAIRGACPAGGCAISLCCDYRVMTDSGRIGLNEVELGIPVPKFWAALMVRVVGQGIADKLCGFAQMSTPQQALNVGMIDEVVATGQLLPAAEAAMAAMLKLPDVGRIATKQQCRQDFVDEWRKWYPIESEIGFTQLSAPSTIEAMRGVIERLGSGRSRL